jgi:hypothetical protein
MFIFMTTEKLSVTHSIWTGLGWHTVTEDTAIKPLGMTRTDSANIAISLSVTLKWAFCIFLHLFRVFWMHQMYWTIADARTCFHKVSSLNPGYPIQVLAAIFSFSTQMPQKCLKGWWLFRLNSSWSVFIHVCLCCLFVWFLFYLFLLFVCFLFALSVCLSDILFFWTLSIV